MRFALLQRSLEQVIDRVALEEASVAAPGIARADCAYLHRHLYGIVARRLEESDALAFQAALRRNGFDTDIVPDADLFRLPRSRRGQGIHLDAEAIVETDLYGREGAYPLRTLMFAAAGSVNRSVEQIDRSFERVIRPGPRGTSKQTFAWARHVSWEDRADFRIDCFFAGDPVRVDWVLAPGGVMMLDGVPVRRHDQLALDAFLAKLRDRLPVGRVNRGIETAGTEAAPLYASLPSYEEEIIWRFHRLRRPAPSPGSGPTS